ncbi:MAG TPA: hypothetical protein VIO80_00800 [Candidatus Dormibacteraeota bacterium]
MIALFTGVSAEPGRGISREENGWARFRVDTEDGPLSLSRLRDRFLAAQPPTA